MTPKVPDGWNLLTLGNVTKAVSRRNKSDAQIKVLSMTKYKGFVPSNEYFSRAVHSKDTSSYKVVRKGEFAYATIHLDEGSIDYLKDFEFGLVSPMYTVFSVDTRKVDHYYLLTLIKLFAEKGTFDGIGNGGVNRRKSVSFGALSKLSIVLPPLPEQRRIAEILSSVDEAIAATQAVIEQTQKVKQAIMSTLFYRGRWDEGRPIPKDWQVKLLDSVAQRGSGHTPNKKHPEYWNGGIKWVSLQDTKRLDQVYISTTTAQISNQGLANSSAVLHPAGVVVLSRDATVGRSAITTEEMAVSQHFIAWRCGPMLNNLYLYYWLQHMKPVFERIGAGSTIKTIGLPFFKKLEIPLPRTEEQDRTSKRIYEIDQSIFNQEQLLKRTVSLKSALMSDLLSGRVRVPLDRQAAAE